MPSLHIVLTGVSRGLGRAMTDLFAQRGHRISGCARNEAAITQLREEWGSPHHFSAVDLRDEDAVSGWAGTVLSEQRAPDLLINCAAVMNRNAPLWEIGGVEFSELMDINVNGLTHVIRAFTPAMIEQGSGVIVNFSSGWGRSTSPEVAPYCASKWAVEGLTRALAQELPAGLAAVAFNPGIIDTDMLRSCFGSEAAHHPGPDEWAAGAVPFLERLSAADNGEVLTCPGH